MALKGLRDYEGEFRTEDFLKAKRLQTTECTPHKDYDTKKIIGTRITVVILEDHTSYTPRPDGTMISNIYEKLVIKVPKIMTVPIGAEVRLTNPKAKVWGEYRNNLSITADDVQVVTPGKP